MDSSRQNAAKREPMFRILMDDGSQSLTLIHAAPIRTADDFRRVHAEFASGLQADPLAALSGRRL